jgi:hypothetical protein
LHSGAGEGRRRRLAVSGGFEELVEARVEVSVVLARVGFQCFCEGVRLCQEAGEGGDVQLAGMAPLPQPGQVAGVQLLLEVLFDGDGEHRDAQVDDFAHQGVAAAGDHRAGGAEVFQEAFF